MSPVRSSLGSASLRAEDRLRWLRQAAATLLLGLAPLALLEGSLRLCGWPTERVRSFRKLINFDGETWSRAIGVFRPGARASVMWPPELSYEVHINTLGLRGPEIERSAPPGRTRILALGDSMTFGYYLDEAETWPARLEARLRADGLDAEVVNGGCGRWSIDSETTFLLERGLALEPDHVLVGFFSNDINDLAEAGEPTYVGQKRAVGRLRGTLSQMVYSTATYELTLRMQVAWDHWREGRPAQALDPLAAVEIPSKGSDEDWARYAQWLDRMHEALGERGIPLTLVYLPNALEVLWGKSVTHETRLRELARERGIGFVSALAQFKEQPDPALYHLPLDDHFAAEGADRIARVVAQAIAQQHAR